METETIESLKQYRNTLAAEIAAKRKQLVGVSARIRTILQEELDNLCDDEAEILASASKGTRARSAQPRSKRENLLPRGYWPYVMAKYLRDTRQITFKMSDIVGYLEERIGVSLTGSVRNRIGAALSSAAVLAIVKRTEPGVFSIRDHVTIPFLEVMISEKEREGIEISALGGRCETSAGNESNGTNGNENSNAGAGSAEENGGVQGLSV